MVFTKRANKPNSKTKKNKNNAAKMKNCININSLRKHIDEICILFLCRAVWRNAKIFITNCSLFIFSKPCVFATGEYSLFGRFALMPLHSN